MTSKLQYSIFILLLLISCEDPTELDIDRKIDYEYVTKKNLELATDTIDFGFVNKDAFYKEIIRIENISLNPVEIKNIYFENKPSIFYFDPSLNLENLIVPSTNSKELNFYLNLRQGIVGNYEDKLIIETDTIYKVVLKSCVPDIMVQDLDTLKVKLGSELIFKVNVKNFGNYVRTISKLNILNNDDNIIKYNENLKLPRYIGINNNYEFEFKVIATKAGTFRPIIQFDLSKNIISKDRTELIIVVD